MLLVVLALAMLPALGEANLGALLLKTRNLEKLAAGTARSSTIAQEIEPSE